MIPRMVSLLVLVRSTCFSNWIDLLSLDTEKSFQPTVHVHLVVTMEESGPQPFRPDNEIHSLIRTDHDRVFHYPGRRYAMKPRQFKRAAVQMHGMKLSALIGNAQSVVFSLVKPRG